jgi:alcohol dehydrogenase (cytochrome c)
MRFISTLVGVLCLGCVVGAQAPAPGRTQFENRCGVCHGGDGNGGEYAPGMVDRLATRNDAQLATLIHDGLPGRGMPGTPALAGTDLTQLIQFLRTLRPRAPGAAAPTAAAPTAAAPTPTAPTAAPGSMKFELTDGRVVEGTPLTHGVADDLQLRTSDGRVVLLRKTGTKYRRVTSEVDWATYDGSLTGNRYSTMTQINKNTVSRLAPKWIYTIQNTTRLEGTPIVVDGIMYVTTMNECYALDAGNGREIWRFQRPRTQGLIGNATGGINRGVTVANDRLFMVTDHAHLLALNRFTGQVLWDTEMADWHQNYNATGAPLIVGDLVVSGTAGGEQGADFFPRTTRRQGRKPGASGPSLRAVSLDRKRGSATASIIPAG